jgi:histidine triad (HIT) family protein
VERHAPAGYQCPFCALVAGRETELNAVSDIVLRSERTTAIVSPKWWASSPGHVLVVPNEHYEHLYEIADEALAAVYVTAATVARAMRTAYDCEGVSTRQHNEPGAGQDVWHFHVHVFPRRGGDGLYLRDDETRWTAAAERAPYAQRLAAVLADYPPRS